MDFTGPVPTIWDSDSPVEAWHSSQEYLMRVKPPAIQIHSWSLHDVVDEIRRSIPGVRVVAGFGVDGIARRVAQNTWSVSRGVRQFVALAHAAWTAGAEVAVWNAEAGWKRPPTSEESKRLQEVIRSALLEIQVALPRLRQWHTAYDHPHFHTSYPWKAWLGKDSPIELSLPQVYAAPEGGLVAHRGSLQARETKALASWKEMVRRGQIREDAPAGSEEDLKDCDWIPYYQLHHNQVVDLCKQAVTYPFTCFWALRSRSDEDGRKALAALCELHRRGYWRSEGIKDFQRDSGLTPDGSVGPMTLAALGVTAEPQ